MAAQPSRTHGKSGDSQRLKHGALFIFGPAAQLAPNYRDDSGEPGRPAKHAVEEARSDIA